MDYNEINKLLDKYWAAETSPAEEKRIRAFFSKSNLPPELEEMAAMFRFFDSEKKEKKLDQSFEKDLFRKIEGKQQKKPSFISWKNYSIAASILFFLAVGTWFFTNNQRIDLSNLPRMSMTNAYEADTFEDPKEAFEHTKKTLLMISERMERGKNHIVKIEKLNEAKSKIKD